MPPPLVLPDAIAVKIDRSEFVRRWRGDTINSGWMGPPEPQITQLLIDAQQGDSQAADLLFPIVYSSLRELARRQMSRERNFHTLQPTALVHEAYLKLIGGDFSYTGKEQFFRAAATAMRRILIDYAKARSTVKRGSGRSTVVLEDCHLAITTRPEDILAVDEAISRLEAVDVDAASAVRMRFYIGLTLEEIAQARGVSVNTISREWNFARAFLLRELSDGPGPQS